jgi:hypothetical protein
MVYYYFNNIVMKNINNRVDNGLLVFNQNNYQTKWNDIDTQYFNQYFQENMDLKIADFYWASSRKSYLPVGESWDFPAYQAIEKVLASGARLIHLNVYWQGDSVIDPNAIPVVRNNTISPFAKPLQFKKCLEVIRTNAWKWNSEYPLILYLEMGTDVLDTSGQPVYNKVCFNQIGKQIMEVFSDKLINKIYGFNGRDNKYTLGQIPISAILGKIAIMTNVYPATAALNEITHGVANDQQQFNKLIPYSSVNQNYGGLRSTLQDKKAVIQHNFKYLSLVNPVSEKSLFNFLEPKDDIYNISPQEAWNFGCQMVMMNYQLLDENLKIYLQKFNNASLVLKPEKLRYIPKPPPKIKSQSPQNYYGPRDFTDPGWYNHTL